MSEPIKTPRGTIIQTGNVSCKLIWNPDFGPQTSARYSRAQETLDREVLQLCSAYVPLKTGALQRSGTAGSGVVQWNAAYAKSQYYDTPDSRSYDPKRGAHWFERMKADQGKAILSKVQKIGGGSE